MRSGTMLKRVFTHFHFCCGLGGGAKGCNRARPVAVVVGASYVIGLV